MLSSATSGEATMEADAAAQAAAKLAAARPAAAAPTAASTAPEKAREAAALQWLPFAVAGAAPEPARGLAAAQADGCLLVFGGETAAGGLLASVHCWVPDAGQWQLVKTTGAEPAARAGAAAAVVGTRLYIVGGLTEAGWSHGLHSLNLETGEWREEQVTGPLPPACDKLGMVAVGTQLVIFGGFGPKAMDEDDADGASFTWFDRLFTVCTQTMTATEIVGQPEAPWPTARAAHGMCVLDKEVAVFGGYVLGQGRQNDLWMLDTSLWTWRKVAAGGVCPQARSFHTCTALDDTHMLVYGGLSREQRDLGDVHVLDTASMMWQRLAPRDKAPAPRCNHAAAVVGAAQGDDKYIVIANGISQPAVPDAEDAVPTMYSELHFLSLAALLHAVGGASSSSPADDDRDSAPKRVRVECEPEAAGADADDAARAGGAAR